jgi:hypothetical protein
MIAIFIKLFGLFDPEYQRSVLASEHMPDERNRLLLEEA